MVRSSIRNDHALGVDDLVTLRAAVHVLLLVRLQVKVSWVHILVVATHVGRLLHLHVMVKLGHIALIHSSAWLLHRSGSCTRIRANEAETRLDHVVVTVHEVGVRGQSHAHAQLGVVAADG